MGRKRQARESMVEKFAKDLFALEEKGLIRRVVIDGEEGWEATEEGCRVLGARSGKLS